jgi:hypothetical protein
MHLAKKPVTASLHGSIYRREAESTPNQTGAFGAAIPDGDSRSTTSFFGSCWRVHARLAGLLPVLLVAVVVLGLAVIIYGNLVDLKAELPGMIERAHGLIEHSRAPWLG